MTESRYLSIFSNCIITKGYSRSLICDLQNEVSFYVPNGLYEIANLLKTQSISEIKSIYDEESIQLIDEYVAFLLNNELAFLCMKEEFDLFPQLSMDWDYPAIITNGIIDVRKESCFVFSDIFNQLDHLGCKDVQLRIYDAFSILELEAVLSAAETTVIKSIEVFVLQNKGINDQQYIELVNKFPRVTAFYIHGSGEDKTIVSRAAPKLVIANMKDPINFMMHCGLVSESYFTITTELFTESHHYNSCLNRKISIDADGHIKNCPSMKNSFGNIKNTRLVDVIEKDGFKKLWNIKKDQIAVCKDCEFRHICTDCRAFLEDPADLYSKPLKCGYDPYSGTWSEWSKNPIKQKAISHYNL